VSQFIDKDELWMEQNNRIKVKFREFNPPVLNLLP